MVVVAVAIGPAGFEGFEENPSKEGKGDPDGHEDVAGQVQAHVEGRPRGPELW